MNKQEVIEKIKNLEGLTILDKTINFDSEMIPKKEVFNIINQIDNPEKPVVPKYVADMIVERKKQKYGIVETIQNLNVFNNPFNWAVETQFKWVIENQEDFVKAWLYGYEIKKEKLYTAMLKISGEYLRLDCNGNFGHFKVDKKYILDGARAYRFTKDNLVKYHIWGNDNYEVEEVEW